MAVTPLTFSVLRLLADGRFRSGEVLASELGVSRATVWGALRHLPEFGIELYKVRGRGYRLAEPIEWLDESVVHGLLADKAPRLHLQVVDVVDSTNTLLMRLAADGAHEGSCVAAEVQTAGRGRRGRVWHSNLGGTLMFSFLWRFSQGVGGLTGLSLAVGVAVLRALGQAGIEGATLKWPNDVLYAHRKLAGILVEVQGEALGPSAAVIGIGLNLRLSETVKSAIDQAVTDLASTGALPVERNHLLALLLANLIDVLEVFERDGFVALRNEWQSGHRYQNERVKLLLPGGAVCEGVAAGVADDGALLLLMDEGLRSFSSGEVSLRAD